MKEEDLITPAEMNACIAGNKEFSDELGQDESLNEQNLISLQKAVELLTKQVEELQSQLHEQFEYQNRQQEQFLRLCRHQLENKLHEQLVNTVIVHQQAANQETRMEPEKKTAEITMIQMEKFNTVEEPQPSFSRVKSYGKIRKRRKGFLEKLFE